MSTAIVTKSDTVAVLSAIVDRAVSVLSNARTAAEVLEAREIASDVYDRTRKAARLAKAKGAADELIAAAYRVQADALEIEAQAKRRLADEYDAAQERGEIATQKDNRAFSRTEKARGADIIPPKELHEARIIRDAEKADPGIVKRTVEAAIASGQEPTKARVRRAVLETARPAVAAKAAPRRGKEAICDRVREAIVILSGLPPAHEVAEYFAGTDAATIISERIVPAASWLAEFSDAWKEDQC